MSQGGVLINGSTAGNVSSGSNPRSRCAGAMSNLPTPKHYFKYCVEPSEGRGLRGSRRAVGCLDVTKVAMHSSFLGADSTQLFAQLWLQYITFFYCVSRGSSVSGVVNKALQSASIIFLLWTVYCPKTVIGLLASQKNCLDTPKTVCALI
eukprot:COSAG02_NODE_9293_length_2264_cov_3.064203_2_plen_150_part_00